MKHRGAKTDVLSRVNCFFTNQYGFFRIYSEKPKFVFNLIFHLSVSILSVLILNIERIKNLGFSLGTNYLFMLKISITIFDIFLFSFFFFILIKLLKSQKKLKHVLSIVCASYYFISFQKILNCMYQYIQKDNTNYDSSVMITVTDSIFKFYNIFSIIFVIFVIIGLYALTNINIKKLCFGTLFVEIINLALVVFILVITLTQDDLITFKRTLMNIFSKQG